jgi:tetratricopeptide (TPR) repeat protein
MKQVFCSIRTIVVFSFLVVPLFLLSQEPTGPSLEVLPSGDYPEATGDDYFTLGQYGMAAAAYERAVKINPSAYNYFLLGTCYYQMDKYQESIYILTKSINLMGNTKPNFWIIENRPTLLDGVYYSIPEMMPLQWKQIDAWNNRADAKRMLSDYRGSIQDFNVVIKNDSLNHYALYNRGVSKYELDDIVGAYEDARRAIAIKKNVCYYYYLRGTCHLYLERKEKGCLDMSKAGELGCSEAYEVIKEHCN